MKEHYYHADDCEIVRPDGCSAELIEIEDGSVVNRFPSGWTDEQIWHALAFANLAFRAGVRYGKGVRSAEIRRLINADE